MSNNDKTKALAKRWQWTVTISLLLLVGIYLGLHKWHNGGQLRTLTKTEHSAIDTIYAQLVLDSIGRPDSISELTVKRSIQSYIVQQLGHDTASDKVNCSCVANSSIGKVDVMEVDLSTFIKLLPDTKFCERSYFWLFPYGVLLELIFWSWLGFICSILYYVSKSIAAGKDNNGFDPDQIPDHWAKAIYTPIVTVVVYLAIYASFFGADATTMLDGYGVIVFGFILGFFSGRTMKLLERLKDYIFPFVENTQAQVTDKTNEEKNDFDALDDSTKREVIEQFIKEKHPTWKLRYPNYTAAGVGYKMIDNELKRCVVFKVAEVDPTIEEEFKIPKELPYKEYFIPTDVVVGGKAKANVGPYIGTDSPRRPGGGISRIGVTNDVGTIGLKVKRSMLNGEDKYFLLSCYHVVFAPELSKGQFSVTPGSRTSDPEVLSPSIYDQPDGLVLGRAYEGYLTDTIDAALVELDEPSFLTHKINELGVPKGKRSFDDKDEKEALQKRISSSNTIDDEDVLFLSGRTSGKRSGKLLMISDSVDIEYGGGVEVYMTGLIRTTLMSEPGDSGAAVLDKNGMVLGLLVASDTSAGYSYIVPINRIWTAMPFKLITN